MDKATVAKLIQEAEQRRYLVDLSRIESADGVPSDFKPTKTFHQILGAIAVGRRIQSNLVLISGENGAGKTTALRMYLKGADDASYFEARAGYQPKHLLTDILDQLPVTTGFGWRLQTSAVIEYLSRKPRVFLVDEAQRLDYRGLDLLKYVADNTGSMFVLSTDPHFPKRLDRWPDIASRCMVRVEIKGLELDEFLELYQADGWNGETLTEIHRLSRGVMRTIRALFLVIDDHLERIKEVRPDVTRTAIEAPHVRLIAQSVVPTQANGELARRP